MEESRLRQHLEFWQVILHSDTTNGTTKARIKILRDKLQNLIDEKEEGRRITSRTPWMESRDRMTKHLFSSIRERPAGRLITELYDEDNTIISSSVNLVQVWNSFYSKLYACPVQEWATTRACGRVAKLRTKQIIINRPEDVGSPTYQKRTNQSGPCLCKR